MDMGEMTELIVRRGIYSVPPNATVAEASRILEQYRIGSVVVIAGETFLGIATEQDFSRIIHRRLPPETSITEIMTPQEDVIFATPDTGRLECLHRMRKYGFQHLPFKMSESDKKVVGILSIRDLAFDFANLEEQGRLQQEGYLDSAS